MESGRSAYSLPMVPRLLLAREVSIGDLTFGGRGPIVPQTMTVAATEKTDAVYREISELVDAGAVLIRVTVPGTKAAESLEPLRARMSAAGIGVPLVADIHFSPEAAMRAADFVEKVRVNPGNFAESSADRWGEHTEADLARALARVEEKFAPLVEKCKRLGRVMRIGSNHGSLSPRIMAMHGDSPKGMVESALEYARIAEALDYHEIVLSMKASHVGVCVNAYRLLALELLRRSEAEGLPVYPLHLGVTEAGEGEDARLKSYIGMGSLLQMGIGDTVRVSLTEDAIEELPATAALVERFSQANRLAEPWTASSLADHFERSGSDPISGALPAARESSGNPGDAYPEPYSVTLVPSHWMPEFQELLELSWTPMAPDHIHIEGHEQVNTVIVARGSTVRLAEPRLEPDARERTYLELALNAGVPLLEGRADRVAVMASSGDEAVRGVELGYALLQTTRLRMSRADFISCPSCGRTNFDLQETTRRIRDRFGHLPGVKIAVMGCIVNGPGEMADADFGYVGAAPGKVDLYVKRERRERNIPSELAVDRLQSLLTEYGVWREPLPESMG